MAEKAKEIKFDVIIQEGPKGFFIISPDLCKGCGLCPEKCPVDVIDWSEELGIYGTPMVEADMKGCIACGTCQAVCPECAIKIIQRKKASESELRFLHERAHKKKSHYEDKA